MKRLAILAVLLSWWLGMMWAASAQQGEMPLIDRDLWQAMQQAFGNISMPLQAHQQVLQIMQGIEQEAIKRKAQKDTKPAEKP